MPKKIEIHDQVTHRDSPKLAMVVKAIDGDKVTCIIPGKNRERVCDAADLTNYGQLGPLRPVIL